MAADAALYGIGFGFQPNHFLPEFFKCLAFICKMTLDGLLKRPATFFNLFSMFLKALER
jgi:hypothetical protein